MTIGTRIRKLRTDAGMTMDALGELFSSEEKPLGITKQAISAWESDRNQLTADQIIRICNLFKVRPEYLLFGDESRKGEDRPVDRQTAAEDMMILISAYKDADEEERNFLMNSAKAVTARAAAQRTESTGN